MLGAESDDRPIVVLASKDSTSAVRIQESAPTAKNGSSLVASCVTTPLVTCTRRS